MEHIYLCCSFFLGTCSYVLGYHLLNKDKQRNKNIKVRLNKPIKIKRSGEDVEYEQKNPTNMTLKVKSDHRSKFVQFKQLERRSLKKTRASTGFEPVTSAIPVRCSTNWAMSNLLSSYLPVQWNDVRFIWNNSYLYCGCRWIISYRIHIISLHGKTWTQ